MTDQNSDNEVNALNVFGADQMVTRRQQAKELLQQKVADIQLQRNAKASDQKKHREYLQDLLVHDPRYLEIKAILNHDDMHAIGDSLEDHMKTYLNSWCPSISIDKILAGTGGPGTTGLNKYRLGKGGMLNRTIGISGISEYSSFKPEETDESVINRHLATGGGLTVNLYSRGDHVGCAWQVKVNVSWDEQNNGMKMSYYDSSTEQGFQRLSRLDELYENVALTLSVEPCLWKHEQVVWHKFRSEHHDAIMAFEVMCKGSALGTKLKSYFNVFDLWELGVEDEVKLMIQQIHNQFHQTELLQQIANNTSSGARFSAASYGVSSSNAVALSGISEQISQLSQRVEQLSSR